MATYQSIGRLVTLMFGDAYYAPLNDSLGTVAGYSVNPISQISLGTPAAPVVDYITVSTTVSGTTAFTLAHTSLDVPRSVTAVGAAGANAVLNIVGADAYGNAVTESVTLNGATAVETAQAFKTITSVTPASGSGSSVTVGTGSKLGLPVKLNKRSDLMQGWLGAVQDGGGMTVVVGSTSAGADDRGTVKFTTALNGTLEPVVWMKVDATSRLNMVGIA
jgi:hypothetical protein